MDANFIARITLSSTKLPPNVVSVADHANWIGENLIPRLPSNHLDVLRDKALSIRVSIS